MFLSDDDAPLLEYVGQDGYSQPCVDAVIRLLLAGHRFNEAIVVTHEGHEHAFLLCEFGEPRFAVRWGFTSNSGEGSSAFKSVATLLSSFGSRLDEVQADSRLWSRFAQGKLTREDLYRLRRCDTAKPGLRFLGIVGSSCPDAESLRLFPPSLPWASVDARISDLALALPQDPHSILRDGYARLEEAIRRRAGVASYGKELIAAAFKGPASALLWPGVARAESDARADLFLAAFKAYRNPLAHGVSRSSGGRGQEISDFLLLNHLFRLEAEALPRSSF